MQCYVDANRERNGQYGHVEFLKADVTEMELAPYQYDVIFSNWLLMYLSDDEVATLTTKMLSWLKDDGFLFVRESCFHPSGSLLASSSIIDPLRWIIRLQLVCGRKYQQNCFGYFSETALMLHFVLFVVAPELLWNCSGIIPSAMVRKFSET